MAWVIPRKCGKTTVLAAESPYVCLEFDGSPDVLLTATSDKQAGRMVPRDHEGEISRALTAAARSGGCRRARTLHGENPQLVVCDELHAWVTPTL